MVANDENVEEARASLSKQVNKELEVEYKKLKDQQDKLSKENAYYEGTIFDSWMSSLQRDADQKLDKLKEDPDEEILFYECKIYNHANE